MRISRSIPIIVVVLLVACGSSSVESSPATSENVSVKAESTPSGAELFKYNCTLCHGRDGKLGMNGAKDITASALSKEEMIALVTEGKGQMMSYKNVLTAKEIALVVAYVRTMGKPE